MPFAPFRAQVLLIPFGQPRIKHVILENERERLLLGRDPTVVAPRRVEADA